MIKTCQQCDKEFRTCPSLDGKFCSKSCYWKNKSGKPGPNKGIRRIESKICSECKLSYFSYSKKSQFCSRRCAYTSPIRNKKISQTTKGLPSPLKGIQKTPAFRRKVSLGLKGKYVGEKSHMWRGGTTKCQVCGKTTTGYGGKWCREHWQPLKGKDSHLWRGGVTPEIMRVRNSTDMKNWRDAVFRRDDFRCLDCRTRGGRLEADHIKPFCLFPDLRFIVSNGRTLCRKCHRERTRIFLSEYRRGLFEGKLVSKRP